jgi:hypothetical protein
MWGSQHPSSKERQETALGKRKRKPLGPGSSGHGARPGGALAEEKKAWLREELAPPLPPTTPPYPFGGVSLLMAPRLQPAPCTASGPPETEMDWAQEWGAVGSW